MAIFSQSTDQEAGGQSSRQAVISVCEAQFGCEQSPRQLLAKLRGHTGRIRVRKEVRISKINVTELQLKEGETGS